MKRTLLFCLLLVYASTAGAQTTTASVLQRSFDFSKRPDKTPQYFSMESKLTNFSRNGDILDTDTYSLLLMYDPKIPGEGYRCARFRVTFGDTVTKEIPALKDWVHVVDPAGLDSLGRVFGIDHRIFDSLRAADGTMLPVDKRYHVYNAFMDFHAICTVFPQPSAEGGGIQDLHHIGDRIEHSASYSKPPTNLGSTIKEGSFFQNGRIMLEFKGLSLTNSAPCALIGYDSGESRFKMIMEPVPGVEATVEGRSQYRGDIFRSLRDNWVLKANLQETVISGTRIPVAGKTIYTVVERHILIKNINKKEYQSLRHSRK